LPVLPFVFARADRPFLRNGLPLLVGMAATFALVATLAAVGGSWAVQANDYGRAASLFLLALFGVTLLFPELAARATAPLVALGVGLSQSAENRRRSQGSTIVPSLLLGIATGLLWAPCAGPILGLVLAGAALQGANSQTSLLLLAYAAGAATSLALALLVGRRVFTALKRSLGVGEWIRRGAGVAVLTAVAAIALGFDTGFLAQLSLASTTSFEQGLLETFHATPAMANQSPSTTMSGDPVMKGSGPTMTMSGKPTGAVEDLAVEGNLPALSGAVEWLNSSPLTAAQLQGKVVLVDFWTYSCINCLRELPYVQAWAAKYQDKGLVVIGVHSPEFAFEKDLGNVHQAVADLKIGYPVAVDNNYAIWRAFNNEYWPALYFVDAKGQIRHHHFGEDDYDGSEKVIQQLLAESGASLGSTDLASVRGAGAEQAPDLADMQSSETYIGWAKADNFVSPGGAVQDSDHVYSPGKPALNEWSLAGDWTIGAEQATLGQPGGRIVYRFHARDLHLVLGPGPAGKPVRFSVTIDGAPPGDSRGTDVDASGQGVVTEQRLYQLVRQSGPIADHTFEIQFLDPGVQAYSFTFG
jgi:cytochrome c biogenesis protein CcdA/thiol-disulfide isomerase/thioredoxin